MVNINNLITTAKKTIKQLKEDNISVETIFAVHNRVIEEGWLWAKSNEEIKALEKYQEWYNNFII